MNLPAPAFSYMVFAWSGYDPCGGWGDFKGAFNTLAEAKDEVKRQEAYYGWSSVYNDWRCQSEIIDLATGEEVE